MCTDYRENLILFVAVLNLRGTQQFHCFPLVGKVGKTQLESGENSSSRGVELLPSALQISKDVIGIVQNCEQMYPSLIEMDFFRYIIATHAQIC